MAITITIAGVDRSSYINWESLRIEQQVTNQVDSASFIITKYGTKTYEPALGDSVLIQDGATDVFGGTVVRIENSVDAGGFTTLEIECVSHERTLDRYLVSREFYDQPARYLINGIIDSFVNRIMLEVDLMESNETWVQEDGTVVADTDTGDYMEGDQSLKFTATSGSTATARRVTTLDMTVFGDGSASTTADEITLWFKVDTVANFSSLRIRFGSDTGATYTNYYEYTWSGTPIAGWNQLIVAKSAFTATGSPNWNDIKKRQYRVTASGSGTVNVQIDDVRMVDSATAFYQQNVTDADTPEISLKFNYENVSDAIRQIAEAVGNDWYIDADRDVHFYQLASEAAPFGLSDTSQNFLWNTLRIRSDLSTIKNQIYVRGGEYEGSQTDYDVIADGTALNFRSPYRIKEIEIYVDSGGGFVQQTVGVDNLDDPASYDCLYNFQEKNLKFKAATKPADGDTVRMRGNPMIPVIVKKGDPTSIAAHGTFEYLIIDKSITSQQGARDRATAELRDYRDSLVEGNFRTSTSGLRAGQALTVGITARGISDTYLIQSVVMTARSPTTLFYDVSLISTRTYGIIEYLLGLLRDGKKQIAINDNEVVDLAQDIAETLTCGDSWVEASTNDQTEDVDMAEDFDSGTNQGTIFVFAPYTHASFSDTKRAFILEGSRLG